MLMFAAAWEVAGSKRPRALRRAAATLQGLTSPRLTGPRLAGAGVGALAALAVAPAAPGRLVPIVAGGLVAAGFVAPDAWEERAARRRRAAIVAALPDALDLVAVGVAGGRTPVSLFSEIAAGTAGPLARELALTIAEIEAGARQHEALASLRERTGLPELGAMSAALERSRRYGSPLAEQLHSQAMALRTEEQRRIAERAARAAPKIQLVIALVLVPSALLAIAAALIAHSDALFAAF